MQAVNNNFPFLFSLSQPLNYSNLEGNIVVDKEQSFELICELSNFLHKLSYIFGVFEFV